MRKAILVVAAILIGLCFSTCKKKSVEEDEPLPTVVTSFSKDTSDKFTGLVYETDAEFLAVPVVNINDTILFPYFGRQMSILSLSADSMPESDFPTPRKQEMGDCTSWATAYGLLGYHYNKIENNSAELGNLAEQYRSNYVHNQIRPNTSIRVALEILKTQGCCKRDLNIWNVNFTDSMTQPNAAAIDDAGYHKISFYKRIDGAGDYNTLDIIRYLIRNNYPLPFGGEVDTGFMKGYSTSFEKRSGKSVWTAHSGKNGLGGYAGPHAMLIIGYDDNIHALKIMNSWGTDWVDNGFAWIDYDFFFAQVVHRTAGNVPWLWVARTEPETAIK